MRITFSSLRTGMLELVIRRTDRCSGWTCDGVTLARVKKLLHKTAFLDPLLENLCSVSSSTVQLWSACTYCNKARLSTSVLLLFQVLNFNRYTSSEITCMKEIQVHSSPVLGIPFLRCDDY
ncbi:hypothetical protein T10_6448 [Trichinella papuae]|uniref:Uncharacterized protein n=1 Tax=Trichinella papuae TaxID=268474 RepID=A0A0V1M7V5_9BILA|nr:hypothetical protein T10_6448 [Trichinella papuae]